MTRHKLCEVVAYVLVVSITCNPIMASAKIRVVLIPQEEQPLNPPLVNQQEPRNTQTPQQTQRPERVEQGSAGLPARVLQRKLGPEGFENLRRQLENMVATPGGNGQGAPNADQWFDLAAPRQGGDDVTTRTDDTQFFSSYKATTVEDADRVVNAYGGIPGGGVVLEGTAGGLDSIEEIGYHRKFNAFVLDGRAVYFLKIPRKTAAILCRAIAEKDQVGVSLGKVHLVYGAVPESSDIAYDLKLADRFLGDIVFAQNDWTRGYIFPSDFSPQSNADDVFRPIAVFFRFTSFRFRIQQEEVKLTHASFETSLVPLSNEHAPDGNLLPDEEAIRIGNVSPQFKSNAKHIADNIAHYRQEKIVSRTFAYGEVAAFLRWLKSEGADLQELAEQIDR
jgi:hypothetical protein